ncbi:MAG: 5'-nucleotidase C-terminal domain-containing protein [Lachnospiraceae bacterium]|nr:5'-nucleotidase C-terminal domain-containing protein [Lachnospiraceae bacterium]
MKRRRYLKLLICLFLILCLIGCAKKTPKAPDSAGTESAVDLQSSVADGTGDGSLESTDSSEAQPAAEEQDVSPEEAREIRILVIETTDIHGCLIDASTGDPDTFQYRLAYLAQVIGDIRASGEYDDVLLLDGGDIYQGTPVSNLTGGASMRAYLDYMRYDAVCLGNHEFDREVTAEAADGQATVPPYTLGDYAGDPDIPVLASGLLDAATGGRVPFTKDYAIIEKAGIRIAVVGYIPDYSKDVMSSKMAPYRIDGSLRHLDQLIRKVKEEEAPDTVIVLAHEAPTFIAPSMDPSLVSLIAGGHTHRVTAKYASNGIACIQGQNQAKGYASAVLVRAKDGSISVEDPKYTDITGDKAALYDTEENAEHLDDTVMDLSYTAWEAVWEEMSEVLGYIDTPVKRGKEGITCSAGNWVTHLMLEATREDGAVAAFYNTGGIRANLTIPEGETIRPVTIYDIYTVMPFGNSLLLYDVTGKELAQQLTDGMKDPAFGDQMSGLRFTYTATGDEDTKAEDREYTILGITLDDGTEVDPEDEETLYRVCVSDFSATREGSVFADKEPVIPPSDAPIDHPALVAALRRESAENDGYFFVDTGERGVRAE